MGTLNSKVSAPTRLYLGCIGDSKNVTYLLNEGITHILCVNKDSIIPEYPNNFVYHTSILEGMLIVRNFNKFSVIFYAFFNTYRIIKF